SVGHWKESTITDVSILIHMYSVPKARLTVVDSASRAHTMSHSGGVNVEVEEGGEIIFKCGVKSRPPPYNITFMINGKVSPNTRGARDTLRLHPVTRRDAGLYTCLASNTEGDGHSNAIFLRISRE
ncbi:Immunoglobulin-like domain, partial [Trinorchestia longiramus]